MTLTRIGSAIERARTRRPVTWLTLVGVILLPVLVGGLLVVALYNPTERLDRMSAAIVNEDAPVQLDGKTVPLGRQLTAGLVKGSDTVPSNLDWTISNADDAAAGLADGTYTAVITIPKDFSAAATSVSDGATATQATIKVQTAPGALVVDDAITSTITQTAASVFGQALSKNYLENVFVGFGTLGSKLGDAADGAAKLATGAHSAAEGASQLPSGATSLASGANALAGGLDTIAGKTRDAASGAGQLAGGMRQLSGTLSASGQLGSAAATATKNANAATAQATALATSVGGLLATHCAPGATVPWTLDVCAALNTTLTQAKATATSAGTAAGYADGVQKGLASASQGAGTLATSTSSLGTGLGQLAGGNDQSAAGARQLGSGATQLSTGAQSLSDGVAQLATGTDSLASGLKTASASVPAYDDKGATNLATVLSDPVKTSGIGTELFGVSAIPLLAMLALWFGALASFIALRAASARALVSRRSSVLLALRGFAPAAVIGVVQGVLVAGVVQLAASYDAGTWWLFAGLCALAGVAFAAVNQALVAVFGGAGRWVSALVGVLAVAAGVVSTVPAAVAAVASLLPTAPAYNGMVAALTSTSGVGAAVGGLIVWTLLSLLATTLAVARRRTTSARALLSASPSPA
jgi:putative membrane protein